MSLRPPYPTDLRAVRHVDDWHEDIGDVLWWAPDEAPWVGTPLCDDWPGYHAYWTPLPFPNEILTEVALKLNAAQTLDKIMSGEIEAAGVAAFSNGLTS